MVGNSAAVGNSAVIGNSAVVGSFQSSGKSAAEVVSAAAAGSFGTSAAVEVVALVCASLRLGSPEQELGHYHYRPSSSPSQSASRS